MLVLFTGSQPDGVGQKPSEVAKTLHGHGIWTYTMGIGKTFSKPQTLWTATYPGYVYYTYNYEGKNDLESNSKPLAKDIINSKL